jgi:hypothetical protein
MSIFVSMQTNSVGDPDPNLNPNPNPKGSEHFERSKSDQTDSDPHPKGSKRKFYRVKHV